jgi:hypothetical protein
MKTDLNLINHKMDKSKGSRVNHCKLPPQVFA